DERVVLVLPLALLRLADGAGDGVTTAQAVPAHLGQRDVDVVRPGQVPGGPDEGVVVQDVQDPGHGQQDIVLADHRLGVTAEALVPASAVAPSVAVPEPATAAAVAAELVVPTLVALLPVALPVPLLPVALLPVAPVALLPVAAIAVTTIASIA